MKPELTRCPSCGMSVTTWVKDDHDNIRALEALLANAEARADRSETLLRIANERIKEKMPVEDSLRAALRELVASAEGNKHAPFKQAIAKAKEVLG